MLRSSKHSNSDSDVADDRDTMESNESPKAENWEMVDATVGSIAKSIGGSEHSMGSDSEKGKFLGGSQEFQYVHAKAVAQIEADQELVHDTEPLPVSTELHASDIHIISDESLSGFSSPGKGPCPDGPAKGDEQHAITQSAASAFGKSCDAPIQQQEIVGEGSAPSGDADPAAPGHQAAAPHELKDEILTDLASELDDDDAEASAVAQKERGSTGLVQWLLRQWNVLVSGWPLKGFASLYIRPVWAILGDRDWKAIAGVAMLSAMALGLFVKNRKLAHELKRKQEEVTRLMVTIMNFQELWNSNRSNGPVLRHAGISHSCRI